MQSKHYSKIDCPAKLFSYCVSASLAVFFFSVDCSLPSDAAERAWRIALAQGNVRLKSKELVEAEACFREAVRDVRRDKSSSADDVATCLISLGAVLQTEDLTEDSLPQYKKALRVLQKAHSKNSESTLAPLRSLGDIYRNEGQYRVASKYYRLALAILENNSDIAGLRYADLQYRLALATAKAGYPTLAVRMLSKSLGVIMQQEHLPDTDLIENVLSDYMDLERRIFPLGRVASSDFQVDVLKDNGVSSSRAQNVESSHWNKTVSTSLFKSSSGNNGPDKSNFEKIETEPSSSASVVSGSHKEANNSAAATSTTDLRELESKSTRIQPDMEPQTTQLQTSLQRIDAALKQEDAAKGDNKAQSDSSGHSIVLDQNLPDSVALQRLDKQRVDFYERMIEIDAKTLGPEHPSVARDLTGLAYVYLSQDKYDDSKLILNRALNIYKKSYVTDPIIVKRTEYLIQLIGKRQQAELTNGPFDAKYMLDLPHVPVEAQTFEVAMRLNYLALLCYSDQKVDEAQRIYAWAAATTALACGDQSELAGSCLNDYARVLRRIGRSADAAKFESTAQEIVSRALTKQAATYIP